MPAVCVFETKITDEMLCKFTYMNGIFPKHIADKFDLRFKTSNNKIPLKDYDVNLFYKECQSLQEKGKIEELSEKLSDLFIATLDPLALKNDISGLNFTGRDFNVEIIDKTNPSIFNLELFMEDGRYSATFMNSYVDKDTSKVQAHYDKCYEVIANGACEFDEVTKFKKRTISKLKDCDIIMTLN